MSNINIDPQNGAWRYANAIDRYPVAPGDIWKCGPHLLACGDLEGSSPLSQLLGSNPCDFMYVDPPWGAGPAASYRKKAAVEIRSVNFRSLLGQMFSHAAALRCLTYVEMGKQGRKALLDVAELSGGTVVGEWPTTYYRTKPALIIAVTFGNAPVSLPDLTGMDDENTPLAVISHHRPARVLDPMAGRGLTANSAQRCGIPSITNELSPYRMAEALDSLAVLCNEIPQRIA